MTLSREELARRNPRVAKIIRIVNATGKRKTAVARVRLKLGNGNVLVNGKPMAEYFPREVLLMRIQQPFEAAGGEGRYDVTAKLHGGGVSIHIL